MCTFNQFKAMINDLTDDTLSQLCEQFLTDHEGAMIVLSKYCSDAGLLLDDIQIKENMTQMHINGSFDKVLCFGIQLSENQLYKKFHPD